MAASGVGVVPGTVVSSEVTPIAKLDAAALQEIRAKVIAKFKEAAPGVSKAVLLVKGGEQEARSNTGALLAAARAVHLARQHLLLPPLQTARHYSGRRASSTI